MHSWIQVFDAVRLHTFADIFGNLDKDKSQKESTVVHLQKSREENFMR